MTWDFRNKSFIVTGAGAGIGQKTAILLAHSGATIYAIDKDQNALLRTANDLNTSTNNKKYIPLPADVSDETALRKVFENMQFDDGIDGLVCAAGIQTYGTVDSTTMDIYDSTMDINVRGAFLACKLSIPEIRKKKKGGIVLVSSVQAYVAQHGVAAYVASKGALVALTKAMAVDHARDNIRVNVVCPGSVDTPMLRWAAGLGANDEAHRTEILNAWGQSHPLGRVANSEEVADAILYLLSKYSSFITGAELKVDGGLTAGNAVELPDTEHPVCEEGIK